MKNANIYVSPGYTYRPRHYAALKGDFTTTTSALTDARSFAISRIEPLWSMDGFEQNRRPKVPIVILLNGEKRAGKDTAAFYLMCALFERGVSSEAFAFADPIKRMILTMLGIDNLGIDVFSDDLKETIEPVTGKTYRQLAQLLGTEYGRDLVSQTVWIDLAWRRVLRQEAQVYIIKDCRFPNEEERLREINPEGLIAARITRDGRNKFSGADMHPSEQFVFDVNVDYVFDNVTVPAGEEPTALQQHMSDLADRIIAKMQF